MLARWIDETRRNHGLEHATVAVLFERHGQQRIAGRASNNGFFIIGRVDRDELDSCAREALERMQQGARELAVSHFCGTNIALAGFLTATASLLAKRQADRAGRSDGFFSAAVWAMLAIVVAQPAGRWLQRFVTTRSDLEELEIVETRAYLPGICKVITRSRA